VIDTFIVRMGDVSSALLVYLVQRFGLPSAAFASLNLAFIVVWVLVLVGLGREHARRSALVPAGSAP
jgi:hypothetical protein